MVLHYWLILVLPNFSCAGFLPIYNPWVTLIFFQFPLQGLRVCWTVLEFPSPSIGTFLVISGLTINVFCSERSFLPTDYKITLMLSILGIFIECIHIIIISDWGCLMIFLLIDLFKLLEAKEFFFNCYFSNYSNVQIKA